LGRGKKEKVKREEAEPAILILPMEERNLEKKEELSTHRQVGEGGRRI